MSLRSVEIAAATAEPTVESPRPAQSGLLPSFPLQYRYRGLLQGLVHHLPHPDLLLQQLPHLHYHYHYHHQILLHPHCRPLPHPCSSHRGTSYLS